jgi:viroplasmin and RNaseH domain-containing protein
MEEAGHPETDWYYGVVNGKDNYSGVFSDYPTSHKTVEKVSGASWKKFRTMEEAMKFVQIHHKDL